MVIYVSPGIYPREIDVSQYAARVSTAIVGMVGTANRGPLNTPTLITNEAQYINTFGIPIIPDTPGDTALTSYMGHAAVQFLKNGNQLYICRVADTATVKTAETDFSSRCQIAALTPGTWANGPETPVGGNSTVGTTGIELYFTDLGSNRFNMYVYYRGTLVESFKNLIRHPDNDDDDFYIETAVNGVSNYIEVTDDSPSTGMPLYGKYIGLGNANIVGMTSTLGNDGTAAIDAGDYTGTEADKTGIYAFDGEEVDINLLAIPGVVSSSVTQYANSYSGSRGTCLYIGDVPYGSSPSDAIDFSDATGAYTGWYNWNNSYSALFWPWVEYYDAYNKQDVWTPPSGWVLSQIAYNDRVADPWFAPAGLTRGRPLLANQVEYSPSHGERETLYGNQNVINPIVKFPKDGITIWGQRTTQRIASALDRINVRRMLLYAEKVIAGSVRFLVFEPNDSTTWRRFVQLVQPTMDSIKANRGVYDFRVICDETTNTDDLINNNEMRGVILLQPVKSAEVIYVDFTVMATGASFAEYTS